MGSDRFVFVEGNLGRVVNPDGVGNHRRRLLKAAAMALRALAGRQRVDDETRDLAAFIALALREIDATLDVTCAAWEKRDYWLKADQFRREWAWAGKLAEDMSAAILNEQWPAVAALIPTLAKHLATVDLPKRNNMGTPWLGAYAHLREAVGLEKERVVGN